MRFHDYFYYRLKMLPWWAQEGYLGRLWFLIPVVLDGMTWGIILDLVWPSLDVRYGVWLWVGSCVLNFLCNNNKRFARLKYHYRHEKHKKLKGWGLVLYFVGIVALAVIMSYVR